MSAFKKGIIHQHGQLNKAQLSNGRIVERVEWLFVKMGNEFKAVRQVPDQDHFIFQFQLPIPDDQLIKMGGVVPPHMRGPNLVCTCGSEAVVLTDGEYRDHAMCKFYAMFQIHQTGATIKDGVISVPKGIESQYMADSLDDILNNDIVVKRKY